MLFLLVIENCFSLKRSSACFETKMGKTKSRMITNDFFEGAGLFLKFDDPFF